MNGKNEIVHRLMSIKIAIMVLDKNPSGSITPKKQQKCRAPVKDREIYCAKYSNKRHKNAEKKISNE